MRSFKFLFFSLVLTTLFTMPAIGEINKCAFFYGMKPNLAFINPEKVNERHLFLLTTLNEAHEDLGIFRKALDLNPAKKANSEKIQKIQDRLVEIQTETVEHAERVRSKEQVGEWLRQKIEGFKRLEISSTFHIGARLLSEAEKSEMQNNSKSLIRIISEWHESNNKIHALITEALAMSSDALEIPVEFNGTVKSAMVFYRLRSTLKSLENNWLDKSNAQTASRNSADRNAAGRPPPLPISARKPYLEIKEEFLFPINPSRLSKRH